MTVTGTYPSTTTLAATGSPGAYTLTGTVATTSNPTGPTGTLNFSDTTNAGYVLNTRTLGTPRPVADVHHFRHQPRPRRTPHNRGRL